MIFEEERYELGGQEVILRSARPEEAEMLLEYLKVVTGETRFLFCESDEVTMTPEDEKEFVNFHNNAEDAMLIAAYVDGVYAGNCAFEGKHGTRRAKHRMGMGIALNLKYTGFGLGRLMLTRLLDKAAEMGFEQAELIVIEGNDRAHHLYETLGFKECGRIPHANRYDDGTYGDDILMVKNLI